MRLHDVNKGIHKNRKRLRVGRGPGSGHGKTSGRGHKGQGQLAGWSASAIFEGARMPIIRQIPKRGFHNRFARTVFAVNIGDIAKAFPAGAEVTPAALKAAGLARGVWDELKILGQGEVPHALSVSAHRLSRQAREKILAAGGTVTEIPGPAAVVKGQKKASQKTPATE
jgi:ribosomal protein L15, bacterial/organelle